MCRITIDANLVPDACTVSDAKAEGKKFYQYTAVNECSRSVYHEAFECFYA